MNRVHLPADALKDAGMPLIVLVCFRACVRRAKRLMIRPHSLSSFTIIRSSFSGSSYGDTVHLWALLVLEVHLTRSSVYASHAQASQTRQLKLVFGCPITCTTRFCKVYHLNSIASIITQPLTHRSHNVTIRTTNVHKVYNPIF